MNLEDTFGQRPEGCRLSKDHEMPEASLGEATANDPSVSGRVLCVRGTGGRGATGE